MYQRIVVPLDGSTLAETALPHAEELARIAELPLHLVRIVDVTQHAGFGAAINAVPYAYQLQDDEVSAPSYLTDVKARYADTSIMVTTEVRTGTVVRELLEVTHTGDLVVMASHGRGGVARWFLGSVAEEMVRRSTVPVMLIRASNDQHAPMAQQSQVVTTYNG